jgi:glycosyltransferase involved in cell wall biosynthesis
MQVAFVHQNYPAQFGHVAQYLTRQFGDQCVFVTKKKIPNSKSLRVVNYDVKGGATKETHYCSRPFENAVWHAWAVKEALEKVRGFSPDVIVGHSGFGSTLFLPELFPNIRLVNYFEYFYRSRNSDLDFRPDFPHNPLDRFRSRARNAMILLDLNSCHQGYCPTQWQHATLPIEYRQKVKVCFDGIDVRFWRPSPPIDRRVGNWVVPRGMKLVTYATRGMEAMRGFDVFMNVAHRLSRERSDVVFAIAGEDRIAYGGDTKHTGGKTLKQYLIDTGNFDLSRFRFLGLLPPAELVKLFSLSDLHIYLTVPFILSWSVFNALACGTTVLASRTGPVEEVIRHEQNGMLVDFYDEEGFLDTARRVLNDPASFKPFGQLGRRLVQEKYSYEVCLPRIAEILRGTSK